MNIGVVCYSSIGGSGVIASMLGQALANIGHNIHFIVDDNPCRLNQSLPNLQIHRVENLSYPLPRFESHILTMAGKIEDICRIHHLDILNIHYALPYSISAYLAKQILINRGIKPPKIITTLHGTDITVVGVDPSLYDITHFALNQSDGLTAVSKYLAKKIKNTFNPENKVKVINNFIDTEVFKPRINPMLRAKFANKNEFLIGHISTFRPVKRISDVIDIFERITKHLPAKLLLIGEGPETSLARQLITQKNISDKVKFLGNQNRVEELLSCLDLMLMPSEQESFGLGALESLVSGVPVIGTLNTGLAELITHGKNGYLHTVGNTKEMAQSSISLLTNSALLSQFKISARDDLKNRFKNQKIAKKYENYFMEIMNANT